MNKTGTEKLLRLVFMVLPLVGLASLLFSIMAAIIAGHFTTWTTAGIALGLVLFMTLFLKAELANLLYYLNVFVYSALVLGICVVGYLFARAYEPKIDLTEQRLYSLSAESARFLRGLDDRNQDIEVIIFYNTRDPFRELESLYLAESKRIKFSYIDPVKDPIEARRIGDKLDAPNISMGEMFVLAGNLDQPGKNKRFSLVELMQGNFENVLTNAIVEVTHEGETKIYFTMGHGELGISEPRQQRGRPAETSAHLFAQMLNERGMQTLPLDLVATGAVPVDASAVVIAGPTADFYAEELDALRAYLDRGGRLLVALGLPINNVNLPNMEGLRGLLTDYGVETSNEIVIDLMAAQLRVLQPIQPLVGYIDAEHAITKNLAGAERTSLHMVRPVRAGTPADTRIRPVELLRSSDASVAVPLEEALTGQIRPNQEDLAAVPMGVAVSMSDPPQMPNMPNISKPADSYRLAVYGTQFLLEDRTMASVPLFRMLMLNSVNWLAQHEEAIDVPPRELPGTPILLDPAQLRVLFVFAVVMLPGGLFFGGISYSMLRRRK